MNVLMRAVLIVVDGHHRLCDIDVRQVRPAGAALRAHAVMHQRAVIPVSALLGSALMIVIDTLARSLSASEIGISIPHGHHRGGAAGCRTGGAR